VLGGEEKGLDIGAMVMDKLANNRLLRWAWFVVI